MRNPHIGVSNLQAVLDTLNRRNGHGLYIQKRSGEEESPKEKGPELLVYTKIRSILRHNHAENRSKGEEKAGDSGKIYSETHSLSEKHKKVVGRSAQKKQVNSLKLTGRNDLEKHFLYLAQHLEMESKTHLDYLHSKNNTKSSENKEVPNHDSADPMGIH